MSNNGHLKILMFGWEFPPFNSGGLGVACHGLVNALNRRNVDIDFVLPRRIDCKSDACTFMFAQNPDDGSFKIDPIDSILSPYQGTKSYKDTLRKIIGGKLTNLPYCDDLIEEVMRYAAAAKPIINGSDFDIIHAHDWLALPAGIVAKKISGKPLVWHVHATEYDRLGPGADKRICQIEREGIHNADRVIAVSEYTKRRVIELYGADEKKVRVVCNAVEAKDFQAPFACEGLKKQGARIILFVGRLTFQKGPDYFLKAARLVADMEPNVYFMISGAGDMEHELVAESARLGIGDKVFFAGFLRGQELARAYKMADLYVMPSVSDPFGLTALEALASGTPVLVSRQTGASEMLAHCLKIDFWDVRSMASKMIALLRYRELGSSLAQNGQKEVAKFDWNESAAKCVQVYREVLAN